MAVLAFAGCDRPDGVDPSHTLDSGSSAIARSSLEEEGRVAYETYCVGCHGQEGDGKGEAAFFLHPAPRNFQLASFKFSSTRSGQLPTDEDLRRTIREGLRGSAMPGWDLMPARTVTALIAYIKTFSRDWNERATASEIPLVADPYRLLPDKLSAVRRGEVVYHGFGVCWVCHPAYVSRGTINAYQRTLGMPVSEWFRGALRESMGMPTAEGQMVFPPDFLRDFVRSGSDVTDLYRSIAAGITGTAMPTWIDSMDIPGAPGQPPIVSPADLWAMAYYVQSLIGKRPAKLAETDVKIRDRALPISLNGSPRPAGTVAEEAEDFIEEQ